MLSDDLVRGQAQHLIGALIAHEFLPKAMPHESYIVLWDVVMRQLKCVNQEGARAVEAAATEPLLARIAELEAELAEASKNNDALLEALKGYVTAISTAGGGDKALFMAAIREADNAARAAIDAMKGMK